MAAESTTSIYHVEGMDCAHCAREVEASVERLTGVQSVAVDFVSGQMRLRGSVPYAELAARGNWRRGWRLLASVWSSRRLLLPHW